MKKKLEILGALMVIAYYGLLIKNEFEQPGSKDARLRTAARKVGVSLSDLQKIRETDPELADLLDDILENKDKPTI